jgi:hypothetical protein
MTDWKQQIEAQIASLRKVPRHHVPIAYWEMCCRAADDMQALLDVAIAAEDYRKAIRNKHRFQRIDKMGIKVDEALDKL